MTGKTSVVYLQKDKFQFYSPGLAGVIEFRFVPEIIRDLDVINSELLENLIKVFVTNSKISPSDLVFVLAENAYFTKDFIKPAQPKGTPAQPEITTELLQKQAEEFIEHIPFDNVVSKTIPLKDGVKVVATNKDFYESIAIAFEHLGFTVQSVLPGLVIGTGASLRPVLDPPMAALILQKVNTLAQYNLLNQQVYQPLLKQENEEIDDVEIEKQLPKKTNKKNIYALAGIVPILLGLFVAVYLQFTAPPPKWQTQASPPPPPQVAKPVQLATIAPTVPPVTTSSASANTQFGSLTVQIVSTANSASTAQTLLGQLDTYKFESVSLQTQSSISSGSTLVSFSPNVSQDVKDTVLNEVKKLETNVIVQGKQLGTFDITIVLGQ
jgi:hypothetical protein